jgi:hypothetical protein
MVISEVDHRNKLCREKIGSLDLCICGSEDACSAMMDLYTGGFGGPSVPASITFCVEWNRERSVRHAVPSLYKRGKCTLSNVTRAHECFLDVVGFLQSGCTRDCFSCRKSPILPQFTDRVHFTYLYVFWLSRLSRCVPEIVGERK